MSLEIFEIILISTIAFLVILGITVIVTQYKNPWWHFFCYLVTNSAPRRAFLHFVSAGRFLYPNPLSAKDLRPHPPPARKSLSFNDLRLLKGKK